MCFIIHITLVYFFMCVAVCDSSYCVNNISDGMVLDGVLSVIVFDCYAKMGEKDNGGISNGGSSTSTS